MKNFRLFIVVVSFVLGFATAVHAAELKAVKASDLKEMIQRNHKGIIVLNLWATFCEPCRKEMPELLKIRDEYVNKGMKLLLVSCDFDEDKKEAAKFLKSIGVDFETYHKNEKDAEFISGLSKKWPGALPATFVYDKKGKERFAILGEFDPKDLRKKIKTLIKE